MSSSVTLENTQSCTPAASPKMEMTPGHVCRPLRPRLRGVDEESARLYTERCHGWRRTARRRGLEEEDHVVGDLKRKIMSSGTLRMAVSQLRYDTYLVFPIFSEQRQAAGGGPDILATVANDLIDSFFFMALDWYTLVSELNTPIHITRTHTTPNTP